MPRYSYSAFGPDGRVVRGEISAETDALALDLIARQGLTPVSLTEGGSALPWWARDITLFGTPASARPADLERFFTTLSAMLAAHLPLPRAVGFAAARSRGPAMRQALEGVARAIEDGATLADALRGARPAFPERLLALVALGEAANRLADTASRAAQLLAEEARLRRELRAGLIYPAILLLMSMLVLGVVTFHLAPTLLPVFASAGAEPPNMLRALDGVGRFLRQGWPMLLAGLAAGSALIWSLRARIARALLPGLLRLPLIGRFLAKRESLRLVRSLQLMLRAGVPLPRALATTRESLGLAPFRDLLAAAESRVIAGGTLTATLKESSLVDATAIALIEAGEESDQLAQMLEAAAELLAAETAETLGHALRLLTPALTLVVGLGVGGIILGTITAIMDLNDIAF